MVGLRVRVGVQSLIKISVAFLFIVSDFILVGSAMYYLEDKVKKQNIIEGLKDSNV